jgi:beta-glucosidase
MKNRTYRFFTGKPLYPFGYGLSYSTFNYSSLNATKAADGSIAVSVVVRNSSQIPGDEVAQLYLGGWLKGFERVHLAAGESSVVHWTVEAADVHGNIVTVAGLKHAL